MTALDARVEALEEILNAPLEGGPLDAAKRIARIIRIEERVATLHARVELLTQELVAQADALRLLGLVPCVECNEWFRPFGEGGRPAGAFLPGGLFVCAAHVETVGG